MKRNLTLANSEYTARAIREMFGIEPRVVYPPAIGKFAGPSVGAAQGRLRMHRAHYTLEAD